jgi:glycosyltransferase involved in cell wall biosynthesis
MSDVLVSVLCATRNRVHTLERTLASVRQQTHQCFEVLVLDDGSDEGTFVEYERLWKTLDGRFSLHKIRPSGSRGAGPSQARNFGIPLAKGAFVAFLDDDDWWCRDDHLAVAVESMQTTNADYYFANMQGVRGDVTVIPDWYPDSPVLVQGPLVHDYPAVHEVPLTAFVKVMQHHLVHPDAALVRRALLTEVGGFFERVIFGEDYDLMMRLVDKARRILYRPDVVVSYRLPTGDSISLTESKQDQMLQRVSCALHVRTKCTNPLVRRCARAREAWSLRELADELAAAKRPQPALSFAWQAFWAYPTLGAGWFLSRSLARAARLK